MAELTNLSKLNEQNSEFPWHSYRVYVHSLSYLNKHDKEDSEFPWSNYRLYVQRDDTPFAIPILILESLIENFELVFFIKSGSMEMALNYGKRKPEDNFKDIEQKLSIWLKKKTLLPGHESTNQQAALDEYEACNVY